MSKSEVSNVGEQIKITDYSMFQDAQADSNLLKNELIDQSNIVKGSADILNDPSVFAGDIANSCHEALELLKSRMDKYIDNYDIISNYFDEVYESYRSNDEKAANKIIVLDETGTIVVTNGSDELVNKMIDLAKQIANDPRYGYGKAGYGSGYAFDCGGLVWYLLNNVYGLNYDTSQGISPYMLANQLPGYGFERIDVGSPVDQSQLVPGDILVNPSVQGGHAAIYIGNGEILEARWNYDSVPGDSSGDEISINSYTDRIYNSGAYNFNYSTIIRTQGYTPATSA